VSFGGNDAGALTASCRAQHRAALTHCLRASEKASSDPAARWRGGFGRRRGFIPNILRLIRGQDRLRRPVRGRPTRTEAFLALPSRPRTCRHCAAEGVFFDTAPGLPYSLTGKRPRPYPCIPADVDNYLTIAQEPPVSGDWHLARSIGFALPPVKTRPGSDPVRDWEDANGIGTTSSRPTAPVSGGRQQNRVSGRTEVRESSSPRRIWQFLLFASNSSALTAGQTNGLGQSRAPSRGMPPTRSYGIQIPTMAKQCVPRARSGRSSSRFGLRCNYQARTSFAKPIARSVQRRGIVANGRASKSR